MGDAVNKGRSGRELHGEVHAAVHITRQTSDRHDDEPEQISSSVQGIFGGVSLPVQ